MRYNVLHLVGFSAFLLSDVSSKRAGRLLCFSPCRPWAENSAPRRRPWMFGRWIPHNLGLRQRCCQSRKRAPHQALPDRLCFSKVDLGGPLGLKKTLRPPGKRSRIPPGFSVPHPATRKLTILESAINHVVCFTELFKENAFSSQSDFSNFGAPGSQLIQVTTS